MSAAREAVVLTPEHVIVRLEPAGAGRRFLALLVDFLAIAAITTIVSLPFGVLGSGPQRAASATAGLVAGIGWHLWFETRRQGRTPGKAALGLRVVDERGLPLTTAQSLVRNVARTLDALPFAYGLGALATLLDPWHRRLGDIAAATLVVRERDVAPPRIELPAATRYNSLDRPEVARRIRHRLSLEERELLLAACLRAPKLEDAARLAVMEEIGAHYRGVLGIDDPALSGEALVRALGSVVQARG